VKQHDSVIHLERLTKFHDTLEAEDTSSI